MNTRIRELRRKLDLTQAEFGSRIGIKQATITAYECGNRAPMDSTVIAICREYNVSETWLRTGEGTMFREVSRDEELAKFFGEILSDGETDAEHELKKSLMYTLAKLTPDQWKLLGDIAASWNKANEEKGAEQD